MAKRLTVQANAAFTLPLSYIQYYDFVHNAAGRSTCTVAEIYITFRGISQILTFPAE